MGIEILELHIFHTDNVFVGCHMYFFYCTLGKITLLGLFVDMFTHFFIIVFVEYYQ